MLEDKYVPASWHVTVVIYAMLILHGMVNHFMVELIPWIGIISGVLHACGFIVFLIVLMVLGRHNSISTIFLQGNESSGWRDSFVSWNVGMVTCTYGFVGLSCCR